MIRLFFRQYASWIFFLIALQLVLNLIIYIDQGFNDVALFYVNLVWFVLVVFFLLWRYLKDRQLMKDYATTEANYVAAVMAEYEQRLEKNKAELQEQRLLLLERQDELLAWVHEMKAPMTALQLLTEQIESADVKERFENEWLRLYLLLDQQLHATRLMTIEQDNRMEEVSLKYVVVQEVKALRSWCFDKQIAIELDHLDVVAITDQKWLSFIVRQILSNAVKYSEVGGEIQIAAAYEHDQLVLSIQDEGIGIKQEDLPRVFRKSYTGTIGRETSAATGMGLYLAKQAANTLHMKLVIESTEMIGTTVKMIFPKQDDYTKTLR